MLVTKNIEPSSNIKSVVADKKPFASGKRQLMQAALQIVSEHRGFSDIGIRELAREAKLNPNTFYRHFNNMDDLGLEIIQEMVSKLRQPLRTLRQEGARKSKNAKITSGNIPLPTIDNRQLTKATVDLFYDFVDQNPKFIMFVVRELYGASPILRETLSQVISQFAQDMAEDLMQIEMVASNIPLEIVNKVSRHVSSWMFQVSLDYIQTTSNREAIRNQVVDEILMLFTGAMALYGSQLNTQAKLAKPL